MSASPQWSDGLDLPSETTSAVQTPSSPPAPAPAAAAAPAPVSPPPPKAVKTPRKKIPPAVREGAIAEIAALPPGKESIALICKNWGLEPNDVRRLMSSTNEIADLRQAAATRMLKLSIKSQERLMEDLENPETMAATSAKDKAFITKATADGAVTLIEGIPQTTNVINFGDLKRVRLQVEQYRAAKAIEV
jgi:hypothetical protein